MTYRVYDEFEKENISKNENGDFIVKVKYPENEWVYGYILSFGEYVKVLSPEYAKNIIRKRLEKTIKNYLSAISSLKMHMALVSKNYLKDTHMKR